MKFFLNLPTMQCVFTVLAVLVCVWEINNPFTVGFSSYKDEYKMKHFFKKAYSEEIKGLKKSSSLEVFGKDINETFSELDLSPPPDHEHDKIIKDTHKYYNSSFILNAEDALFYWVDLDQMPEEQVISHVMLSDSHRQAMTIALSFDFPFYGHSLRNITIATGGFLYMGDYLHNWIAATQYIAPLMANFDTSLSSNSTIKYADNGTSFTAQWDQVTIRDNSKGGYFTFQVTLLKKGDIIFAYKEIPYLVTEIPAAEHPVKIGLSDAYILERQIFFIRRKTIFEYHKIDYLKQAVSNNTAIYFTALPTCVSFHDCQSCIAADKSLKCMWCETMKRCSDGIDRKRQSWLQNGCPFEGQKTVCPNVNSNQTVITPEVPSSDVTSIVPDSTSFVNSPVPFITSRTPKENDFFTSVPVEPTPNASIIMHEKGESMKSYMQESSSVHSIGPGGIVAIILVVAALFGLGFWIYYAYKFPQSSSGQFLIKYRPSQWNTKPEESSCNTASFHM